MSECTQSVMCAEVGHLELAHDYAREAALIDLRDLHANTRHGLHIASLAVAWSAIGEGFGGLRQHHDVLALAPRLPTGITRLTFRIRHSGLRLLIDAGHDTVQLRLRDRSGASLSLLLYGEQVVVGPDAPVVRAVIPLEPLLPEPRQPVGRAPDSRYRRRQDPCRRHGVRRNHDRPVGMMHGRHRHTAEQDFTDRGPAPRAHDHQRRLTPPRVGGQRLGHGPRRRDMTPFRRQRDHVKIAGRRLDRRTRRW